MKKRADKTVPLDWLDDAERYVVVPRRIRGRTVKRLRVFVKAKGNCLFTRGVPQRIMHFVYRATVKLDLRDRKLIFSRGSVKGSPPPGSAVVEVRELDWDLGTSIVIPQRMKYATTMDILIYGKTVPVRVMEIAVLSALMGLKYTGRSFQWRASLAAAVITHGWAELEKENPPKVYRAE